MASSGDCRPHRAFPGIMFQTFSVAIGSGIARRQILPKPAVAGRFPHPSIPLENGSCEWHWPAQATERGAGGSRLMISGYWLLLHDLPWAWDFDSGSTSVLQPGTQIVLRRARSMNAWHVQ